MPNIFYPDFIDFLKILEKNKINFLLVGGYAVILHGFVRTTGDLDLWVEKSENNYLKLSTAYEDFGAPIFSKEEFLSSNLNVWGIGVAPIRIEILTQVDGLVFNESKAHCKWFNVDDFKIPYIEFDDLIKNKLASGRYKDLADIEQLKKFKK